MAAIPLQGVAASSMVFCKGDHHAAASARAAGPAPAGMAPHDRASHSHGAEMQIDRAADQSSDADLPDAAHKCGVCASCCHVVAIAQYAHVPLFSPVPHAESAEPFRLILTTPASVLDKPPRA